MKKQKLLLALCCLWAGIGLTPAKAQLNADGELKEIYYNGTFQDDTIPSSGNLNGYNSIEFNLKGGDGGAYKGNINKRKGGGGAKVTLSFEIGTDADQLRPEGVVRFIVGQKGKTFNGGGIAGGGGGGGTAILYHHPGATITCTEPSTDFADASSCWVILAAAGGGGGAFATDIINSGFHGKGGNDDECGSNGENYGGGEGGCDGEGGENGDDGFSNAGGGGGGALTHGLGGDSSGGREGGFTGGAGGTSNAQDGGFGFGGGGASTKAPGPSGAGGGGGYSGGGGAYTNRGGGGGSFANTAAYKNEKKKGGRDGSPDNGRMWYQFEEKDGPTARCKDITVALDNNGTAQIHTSDIDDGSTAEPGESIQFWVFMPFFTPNQTYDCDDIGANTLQMYVQSSSGKTDYCTAEVEVEDTLRPVLNCQDITVTIDGSSSYTVEASDIGGNSTDNCGIESYIGSFNYSYVSGGLTVTVNGTFPRTFDSCSPLGTYGGNKVTRVVDESGNDTTGTCFATITVLPDPNTSRWYVDASKANTGNGMTWNCAFKTLQEALHYAESGDEIWVADGTYYPDEGPGLTDNDRDASFVLKEGVAIYGGFARGETSLTQRNWETNVAILSGDLMQNDGSGFTNYEDNAYHIMYATLLGNNTIVDGFTFKGSSATAGTTLQNLGGGIFISNSGMQVSNCTFSENQANNGGAIYVLGNPGPFFKNCYFIGNQAIAASGAGAMVIDNSSPDLLNCVFSGNEGNPGGITIVGNSNLAATNCTFSGNDKAIFALGSATTTLANCILWGNRTEVSGIGNVTCSYSIVEGGYPGTGNLDINPGFVSQPDFNDAPTTEGDLHLLTCSSTAAIDAGDNAANSSSEDLDGKPRIVNASGTATIDIGAYEHQTSLNLCADCFAGGRIYVDANASGLDDGSTWPNAFNHLQDALQQAASCPNVTEIWVADGTYYPDEGGGMTNNDRTASFNLLADVAIYGGFAGGETMLTERDWETNSTILSGDLMQNDGANFANNGDNAYHVVKAVSGGITSSSILDGFAIQAGNADGTGDDTEGAGVFIDSASPSIDNCIVTHCYANFAGGGMALNACFSSMHHLMVLENHAGTLGGGLYAEGSSFGLIQNSHFKGNESGNSGGAALHLGNSNMEYVNCEFSGNRSNQGSAVYTQGSTSVLINSSFSGNNSTGGIKACIFGASGSFTSIINSIVSGNSGSLYSSASLTITNAIIEGGHTGINVLDEDPFFVSQPDFNAAPNTLGDLRITSCSSAIDAGDNSLNTSTEDLDGNPRKVNLVNGAIIDLGAFELQSLTPPVAVCKNQTVQLDGSGNGTLDVSTLDGGSTGCAPVVFEVDGESSLLFDCSNIGNQAVTLTVTDKNNNTSTCSASITVEDKVAPLANCKFHTVQLDANGNGSLSASDIDDGSSDLCGNVSLSAAPNIFNCNNIGSTTVVLTVTDEYNNTATCSTNVMVEDKGVPSAICQSHTVQLNASGNGSLAAGDIDNGSSDVCGSVFLSAAPNTFSCSDIGTKTITLTVTDNNGNSSTCNALVAIEDVSMPQITCPDNIAFNTPAEVCESYVYFSATAMDACDASPTITYSQNPGTLFSVGTTTVTATAMDGSSNTSNCSFDVVLTEDVALMVCQDTFVQLDDLGAAVITSQLIVPPTSLEITFNKTGNLQSWKVPAGVTSVRIEAAGAKGGNHNSSNGGKGAIIAGDFSVTPGTTYQIIVGGQGGKASGGGATFMALGTNGYSDFTHGNIIMIAGGGGGASFYFNGGNAFGFQPDPAGNGGASGEAGGGASAENDGNGGKGGKAAINGALGGGNGGYGGGGGAGDPTFGISAGGGGGGASGGKGGSAADAGSGGKSYNGGSNPVNMPGANNGQGYLKIYYDLNLDSYTVSPNTFSCMEAGTSQTVTVTRTNCNSTSTCTALVTVEDLTTPTAVCQPYTVQLNASGNGSLMASDVDNGSTAACGIASLAVFPNTFNCLDIGMHNVTLTVMGVNDSTATCTAQVTVQDTVKPQITCPGDISIDLAEGECDAVVNFVATATDFCNAAPIISYSQNPGTLFSAGITIVTATATDGSGNFSDCSFQVILNEYEVPMSCQDIHVQLDVSGNVSITPEMVIPLSSPDTTFYKTGDLQNWTVPAGVTSVRIEAAGAKGGNTGSKKGGNGAIIAGDFSVIPGSTYQIIVGGQGGSGGGGGATFMALGTDGYVDFATEHILLIAGGGGGASITKNGGGATVFQHGPTGNGGGSGSAGGGASAENNGSGGNGGKAAITGASGGGNGGYGGGGGKGNSGFGLTAGGGGGGATGGKGSSGTGAGSGGSSFNSGNNPANIPGANVGQGFVKIYYNYNLNGYAVSPNTFGCTEANTTQTVTVTRTNSCNSTSTCTAQIQVADLAPPTTVCKPYTVQLDMDGNSSLTASDIDGGSSDACGIASISASPTVLTCADVGEVTATLTLTDIYGNTATCSAQVTVQDDNVNPRITCPDDIIIDLPEGKCDSIVNFSAFATEGCISPLVVTYSQNPGTLFEIGTTTVNASALDGGGNTLSCSFNVTLNEYVIPAECQNISVQLDPTGNISVTPEMVVPLPSPNHTINGVWNSLNTWTVPTGVTSVRIEAAGGQGGGDYNNKSGGKGAIVAGDFLVTPGDKYKIIAGVMGGKDGDGFGGGGGASFVVPGNNGYSDFGTGNIILIAGGGGGAGPGNGKHSSRFQSSSEGPGGGLANVGGYGGASAINNGGGNDGGKAAINGAQGGGGIGGYGGGGAPGFDSGGGGGGASGGNGGNIFSGGGAGSSYNGGNSPSNIPSANSGNGYVRFYYNHSLDGYTVAPNSFDCSDVGTIQTVTVTRTDCITTSTCTAQVKIEDLTLPTVACKPDTVQLDMDGNGSLTASDIDAGSSAACGIASLVVSPNSFDCTDIGSNTVTLTVTDNKGKVSTCTAAVMVEDHVLPQANCQPHTVLLDASGNGSLMANDIHANSSDACGIASLSVSPNTFGCANIGTNTVTLTVTDVNGNQGTCTATVTVEDNILPTANCQAHTVQLDASGNGILTSADIDSGSSDACGIASLSASPNAFDCSDVGSASVTLTVTDNNGNANTCTTSVTVEDNIHPTANCQPVTYTLDQGGVQNILLADLFAGGSDNCGPVTPISASPASLSCSDLGANNVMLTVVDENGNHLNCATTVTILAGPYFTWYKDTDGDGFSSGDFVEGCSAPWNYYLATELTATNGDCNDGDPFVHTDRFELCNGIDDDCDGAIDENPVTGISLSNVSTCDPANNTFTADVTVTFDDIAPLGTLLLSGDGTASAPVSGLSGNQHVFTSVEMIADGTAISLSAGFNVTSCVFHNTNAGIAPPSCDDCHITGIALSNVGTCSSNGNTDPSDDTFTAHVTVTFSNPPSTGTLELSGATTASVLASSLGTNSYTFINVGFPANGAPISLTAQFSEEPDCSYGVGNVATALPPCCVVDISQVAVSAESCLGVADGSIEIFAEGTSTLRYSVDGGATWQLSNIFENLSPGGYAVLVESVEGGCNENSSANVPTGPLPSIWYLDFDDDGWSNGQATLSCVAPNGYKAAQELNAFPTGATSNTDCNDFNASEFPNQIWWEDADGDGYSNGNNIISCAAVAGHYPASQLSSTVGDCNDNDASVHPGAMEVCNGVDDDCDGEVDEDTFGELTYTGNVYFTNQAQVDAWSECYAVIDGNLTVQNSGIDSLASLHNLTKVTGNVYIKSTGLDSLSWLMNLDTIGGYLKIQSNNQLQTLHGLDSLKSVGDYLRVYYNNVLTDCCPIHGLLNEPGAIGGSVTIFRNDTGCDSMAEVEDDCAGGSQLVVPPSTGFAPQAAVESTFLKIFPNPNHGTFTIELTGFATGGQVRLVDLTGREIWSLRFEEGETHLSVRLENLPAGVYLLQGMDGTNMVSERLLIE